MSRCPLEYLRHILDEIAYVQGVARDITQAEFLADETLKRSVVRSIEIIGEAAKKLPSDFKDKHPDVQWKRVAGMRDHLIHAYFGVDYRIVWDVAKNKLPELKRRIRRIMTDDAAS